MCIRHPLSNREHAKPFKCSIQEYEDTWGKMEDNYLNDRIEEVDYDLTVLEVDCIYGYNQELLFYLLSNQRRKDFYQKYIKVCYKHIRSNHSVVIGRTLASLVLTGDYLVETIERIIREFYDFGFIVRDWISQREIKSAILLTSLSLLLQKLLK